MGFTFSDKLIRNNQIVFIYEECASSGICRVAGRVRDDIGKVFGTRPIGVEYANFRDTADFFSNPVFFGTVGESVLLDRLATAGKIDLFAIAGEKEVYMINVIDGLEFAGFRFESAIVVAGADKPGTIYGLFALSEMLGVSPLVDWLDEKPKHLDEYTLSFTEPVISKMPAAACRGFSVDETGISFDDRNKIVELLLRLKGNHLGTVLPCPDIAEEYGITIEESSAPVFTSAYLPKLWEDVMSAHTGGRADRMMVNAGTVFSREYQLSYYMALAYDTAKWGTSGEESARHFTEDFVRKNFPAFSYDEQEDICYILLGYTAIMEMFCITELNDGTYAPFTYAEKDTIIAQCDALIDMAGRMYDSKDENAPAFFTLVYLPATFDLNMIRMWALTGQNHVLADAGSTYANHYAERIDACVKLDRKLIKSLHSINKGRWQQIRLPVPVKNPVVHTVIPSKTPDLIVMIPRTGKYRSILDVSDEPLVLPLYLSEDGDDACFELSIGSKKKTDYTVSTEDDLLAVSDTGRSIKCKKRRRVSVMVEREKLAEAKGHTGFIRVSAGGGSVDIKVEVKDET